MDYTLQISLTLERVSATLENIEKELKISNTLKAIELCKDGKLGEDFNEVYQYVKH